MSTGCGCTPEGLTTPVTVFNRAGLQTLSCRSGTWAQFRTSMLDALSTAPELTGLATRDTDDFSIALLDAWAVVCDILTFYQERLANEAYLRTAAERLSVGELAKLIGYKLRPGLAASAALAFTCDAPLPGPPGPNTPPAGLPSSVVLPAATQAQTIPDPGSQPATFETSAPTTVRASWNAIALRQTHPADVQLYNVFADVALQGVATGVKVGDRLLVEVPGVTGAQYLQRVVSVTTDTASQTTQVGFECRVDPKPAADPSAAGSAQPGVALGDAFIWSSVRGHIWADQADLVTFAASQQWSVDELEQHINALRATYPPNTGAPRRVYKMSPPAALFGHNAMDYQLAAKVPNNPYTTDWESSTLASGIQPGLPSVDLDAVYPATTGERAVLIDSATGDANYTKLTAVAELTRTGYFLAAKVTRITLAADPSWPANFKLRTTQVFIQTDELPVADVVDKTDLTGSTLMLDGAYLGVHPGQLLSVTGVRADRKAQTETEVVTAASVALIDGYTTVEVTPALIGSYTRSSVTINANTAAATHGETTSEILGSGNAAAPFQRFALKQPPLTYVSAATPSGSESTLTVRVDGVEWTELQWLANAGPTDRVYTVVTAADGQIYVQFGDGNTGARPGTGTNNIVAEYRHGTGSAGLARAGQISTLLSRPLGLKAVTNPVQTSGAADPETIDDARTNAPITVKTLDRIVSLQDVADFAAASAGIAKASCNWVWDGTRFVACVTVAGVNGAPVAAGSDQYTNLLQAMRDASDGTLAVTLCPYIPVTFTLAATVNADPSLVGAQVLAAVKATLAARFAFPARQFGQPVSASEIVAAVQDVSGVVSMTLDGLARTGEQAVPPAAYLIAAPPTRGSAGLLGAELLTVETGSLPKVVLA